VHAPEAPAALHQEQAAQGARRTRHIPVSLGGAVGTGMSVVSVVPGLPTCIKVFRHPYFNKRSDYIMLSTHTYMIQKNDL
jgi:hypothetical protein